ncbi:MAG: hypothetical protein IBX55_14010 [Methyloprofundus sp.]|nr:hypothetical protein [Methyloprofundus sp.]
MAYSFDMARGQAGQLADTRGNTVITLAAEDAIAFGAPLMRGTGSNQAVTSDATAFVGVALFEHNHENSLGGTGAGYVATDAVSVLTQGAVLVTAAVAVEAGDTAYVTSAGAYTNVATGNLAAGQFESDAGAGELAVLTINLP